jgi:endonuclease/exonuclease/phosphatase family metal-dependent hydrolase
MNIDSIGERNEYTTLLQTLAIPGYELIDTLKSKGHPVTIAESLEGSDEPAEKYLTQSSDWGHQKSIDYIFLYKHEGAKSFGPVQAEIQKFPISGKPYRQLSDHFGVWCTIDLP